MLTELDFILPARRSLLDAIGLDIFTQSEFWEHTFCNLLSLTKADYGCHWDATTDTGFKIEIKYSQQSHHRISKRKKPYYIFSWQNLQGYRNGKSMIDYYILLGYIPSAIVRDDCFCLVGLSRAQLGNRNKIVMPIHVHPAYSSQYTQYITTLDKIRYDLALLS